MTKREIYNDGNNNIQYKPNTKKVVVGKNIHSWYKSNFKSYKANSREEAMEIGLNKLSENVSDKKIINSKNQTINIECYDTDAISSVFKEDVLNLTKEAKKWYSALSVCDKSKMANGAKNTDEVILAKWILYSGEAKNYIHKWSKIQVDEYGRINQ